MLLLDLHTFILGVEKNTKNRLETYDTVGYCRSIDYNTIKMNLYIDSVRYTVQYVLLYLL